jgi:CHAT domain-containing protein
LLSIENNHIFAEKTDMSYFYRTIFIAFFLFLRGNIVMSQEVKTVRNIVDSVLINDSLAAYYDGIGDAYYACLYAKKNVEINKSVGNHCVPYAISLLKLARYLPHDSSYYAKKLSIEGLSILKDSLNQENDVYISYLIEHAWRRFEIDSIHEAISITREAIVNYNNEDALYYGYLYYSHAHFLMNMGELDVAKNYLIKAVSHYDTFNRQRDPIYPILLSELAQLYIGMGDVENFLVISEKYATTVSYLYEKQSKQYISSMEFLIDLYNYIGRYDKAIDIYSRILFYYDKIIGKDNLNFFSTWIDYVLLCNRTKAKIEIDFPLKSILHYLQDERKTLEFVIEDDDVINKSMLNYNELINLVLPSLINYYENEIDAKKILYNIILTLKPNIRKATNYAELINLELPQNKKGLWESHVRLLKDYYKKMLEIDLIDTDSIKVRLHDNTILLNKYSPTYNNLCKYHINFDSLKNCLDDNESIIDYHRLGDSNKQFSHVLVSYDKHSKEPVFYLNADLESTFDSLNKKRGITIYLFSSNKDCTDSLLAVLDSSVTKNIVRGVHTPCSLLDYKKDGNLTTNLLQKRKLRNYNIQDKAESLFYQGMMLYKKELLNTLIQLVYYYNEHHQYERALNLIKETVQILQNLPSYQKQYYDALGLLGTCYSINGNYKDALRVGVQRYDLIKREQGPDSWQFAEAALFLSNYYGLLGYYDKKEKLLIEAINCSRQDTTIMGPPILASALSNLAMSYLNDNPEKALDYAQESYHIRKLSLGEHSLLTNVSLYNLALCLNEVAKIKQNKEMGEEAVQCFFESIADAETILGKDDFRLAKMRTIITDVLANAKHYDDAIMNEEEISNIFKSSLGTYNISYLNSQEKLAKVYFSKNDSIRVTDCITRIMEGYEHYIAFNFPTMTSMERANLVYDISLFFDYILPTIAYNKNTPELNSQLYNAQLLRKGMLLDADLESERLIRDSKDSLLITNYDNLIANKALFHRQSQTPINKRTVNIDSLEKVIVISEDSILIASAPYRQFINKRNAKWKDIQDVINDNDLVLEFVIMFDTCTFKEHYAALAITKKSKYPELIPLFSANQVSTSNTDTLSQLIWAPIKNIYKGFNTIYFSPTGILNNLAIEYMICNDANSLEQYNVYRLSSTRELLNRKDSKPYQNAILYGGLSYDAEINDRRSSDIPYQFPTSTKYYALPDSIISRGGFEKLPNTLVEVSNIYSILVNNNIKTKLYTDINGTEDSFKKLSGKNISIIHLATHGMYFDSDEASIQRLNNNLKFVQLDNENSYQEETSLTRSFLVMAGGNMLPHHVSISDIMEDGILTALEISAQYFYNLDLVVLSACQTALGDINNEGVYGLQRAFKKAGANTIIMSLDKVDDEATMILMTEFYKNLMSGKKKLQSLRDAQKYLRGVDNGKYDKPEYWASFIMLDGLN